MGWIQAILGIIKAVPALERLFEAVADAHREAKAKERLEEKLDFIDHAILEHHVADWKRVLDPEAGERPEADQPPAVSESRTDRT